jgi:transglutaminase-like putative cysteine protease
VTWRLEVVHRTVYTYPSVVASSYNEVRMTPESDAHQTVVSTRFATEPVSSVRRYTDYWGTRVAQFDVGEPHRSLMMTSTTIVETEAATPVLPSIEWSDLADRDLIDRYSEQLGTTAYTHEDPELIEAAQTFVAAHHSPAETVLEVSRWINAKMSYVKGVTGVHTNATEAWADKRGVCQDFAHVALVVLRAMGIPARYVSGYLHPTRSAEVGERLAGESHAWVEVWTGGWWGFDPTNLDDIGHRHVAIGRGRDYADVAPVRGVHSGGGSAALAVEVTSTRLR